MDDNGDDALIEVIRAAGASRAQAHQLLHGRGSPEGMPADLNLAVAMADPVGIQATIFASRRLITAAGASAALADWDSRLADKLPEGWAVVYSGAGQAVLLGGRRGASRVRDTLERAFRRELHGQLAVAWLHTSLAELGGQEAHHGWPRALGPRPDRGFGSLLARLAHDTANRKDGGELGWANPGFEGRRCAECGQGRADPRFMAAKEGSRARLCARCNAFHQRGRQAATARIGVWEDARLAWLAIDGTGIGARLQRLRTIAEYRAFSRALTAAFSRNAIDTDLASIGFTGNGRPVVMVAGGDDISMVMPAAACGNHGTRGAMELACRLVRGIARRFATAIDRSQVFERAIEPLTCGVGLVLASGLDASYASRLARGLVRSAKKGAPVGSAESWLDFEVLAGSFRVERTVDDLRAPRRIPEEPAPYCETQLTLRPYPLGRFSKLLELAGRLSGAGPNGESDAIALGRQELYRLREAFEQGAYEGVITTHYLLSRSEAGRHLLHELFGDQGAPEALHSDSWSDCLGWSYLGRFQRTRSTVDRFGTAIPDLMDICGLARRGEA